MVDCTLHTAVVHVASPTRCSVSRVIPPFSEREKIRARSRRGGVVVSGSGGIKNRMVRNLSIAVKIGREIRWLWPTVIERGGRVGEYVARRRCATRQRGGERVNGGEGERIRGGTGGVVEERKCIVGDIVYGPRRAGARCSDAHNGRNVHLPQEPIIRYGGRSLYVPPLSLARIAYGPLANSFLSNPISPPSLSPFCPPSPY